MRIYFGKHEITPVNFHILIILSFFFNFRLSPPQTSYTIDGEAHGAVAEIIDSQPIGLIACSRQEPENSTKDAVTTTIDSDCKWSCKMCTYKNWPRSIRCVQCYTKKGVTTVKGDTSPSREMGATAVASQRSTSLMTHSDLERDIIDTKSIIDCGCPAEASSNQHQIQERLRKMQIATNIDAEMNASNSAASAAALQQQGAAGAGAGAQRLSPIEDTSTIHLNNLANSSSQTQSSSTCLSSTSTNPQLPSYTKKWACNVSIPPNGLTKTQTKFPKKNKQNLLYSLKKVISDFNIHGR